jgi:hypothetical protein
VKKIFPFVNLDVVQNTIACMFYLIKVLDCRWFWVLSVGFEQEDI